MTQLPFVNAAVTVPAHENPLAHTPVSDWVRDIAAVVLLLASLALPWSLSIDGGKAVVGAGHTEVILITILSVLSIGVTYLARFGVLGGAATLARVVAIRAALNAPYVVLVIVYVVLDAVRSSGGLGGAAALGLAGALLAAGTRAFEVRGLGADSTVVHASFAAVAITFVVVLITALMGIILPITTYLTADPAALSGLVTPVIAAIGFLVLFGLVLRRSETARLVGTGIGIAVLATVAIDALSGFVLSGTPYGLESLYGGGYPTLWLAAGATILSAPSLRPAMHPTTALTSWFTVAKQSLLIVAIVAGVLAVFDLLTVVFFSGIPVGFIIATLLCHVLATVAALIARVQLVGDPAGSRTAVIGIAIGIAIFAIIAVVLGSIARNDKSLSSQSTYGLVGIVGVNVWAPLSWTLIGILGLVVVVGHSLLVPSAVREYYRSAASFSRAPIAGGYPAATRNAAAVSVSVSATLSDAQRRASDPATPAAELHGFASDRELWPYLASNPALYPDLRQWLESTGDPEVLAILEARST